MTKRQDLSADEKAALKLCRQLTMSEAIKLLRQAVKDAPPAAPFRQLADVIDSRPPMIITKHDGSSP